MDKHPDTAEYWKSKFLQQNKDLGCEQIDPNGTIWDYAKKLQEELDGITTAHGIVVKALNAGNKENIALKDENERLREAVNVLIDTIHYALERKQP